LREGIVRNRQFIQRALVLIAASMLSACASAPPPTAPIPTVYRIGAPDVLRITVLPEPAIERGATVRPDGFITVDLIGDVKASGRTSKDVAEDIEKRIARFKRDARATVSVERAQSNTVAIFGEVGREGSLALTQETRVADAIARQGGMGFLAWSARVRLIRSDGEATTVSRVDMSAIMRGDLATNALLQGGDIIVVPPTPIGEFGYFVQSILFPFTSVMGPASSVARLTGF
jgi:polysaccharide export outer membrane protein